jgi:hypothetical protein
MHRQGGGGIQLEPNMQRAATRMHLPLLTGTAPYRYRHEDGTTLPLCITQYFPSGSEGQYTRVTIETLDPVSQAKSADLAHAWSKGAQSWGEEGMPKSCRPGFRAVWEEGCMCCPGRSAQTNPTGWDLG